MIQDKQKKISIKTNPELGGNIFWKGSVVTPADFKACEKVAKHFN